MNRAKWRLFVFAICLLVSVPAQGGYVPTIMLSAWAKHYKGPPLSVTVTEAKMKEDRASFIWYIVGVSDVLISLKLICLPDSATPAQQADVVVDFLDKRPLLIFEREVSGNNVVGGALMKAYPCE